MKIKKRRGMLVCILAVVLVFVIAACIVLRYRMNSRKYNSMTEQGGFSYPIMEVEGQPANYNLMFAYRDDIDLSLVRNQVTVAGQTGELNLRLYHYDYDITAIQYELFLDDPEKPLEKGTLNKLKEEKDCRAGKITLHENLKPGGKYYLKMAVRLDSSTRVYFYTRLQGGSDYNLDEYLSYVQKFHSSLFDKTTMEEMAMYLEPEEDESDLSLGSVNIHSSIGAVFFGSMKVKEETKPQIKLREINDTYAVLEADTVLSSETQEEVVQFYDLKETYKLRYTPERMYLLDYQRTMDAYYNEAMIDPTDNYVGLGIQNNGSVDYISSDDGKKLCFTARGQLWYYDYNSSDVSKVYSFSSEDFDNLHNRQDDNGIKILKMDDKGIITYLVYGYMGWGNHEGQNGIGIMRFNPGKRCTEEIAFLDTSIPGGLMKEDIEKMAYLNKQNTFYCLLDGDLHEVELDKGTDEILRSGLVKESLTASRDKSVIAIERQKKIWENQQIDIIKLESGKTTTVTCGQNKRIRAVGFLAEDFIYGSAEAQDVKKRKAGSVLFPANEIHIVDSDGEEIKQYHKPGRYILDTQVNDTVLEMQLGRKNGKNFTLTGETDHIRYKEEASDAVTVISKTSPVYGQQLYFKFPEYIYVQIRPDLVLTDIIAREDEKSVRLARSGEKVKQYYIYANGQKQDMFTDLPSAVKGASEARGNVIDNNENILWQCVFEEYDIVAGMENVKKVSSDKKSLAACLSMIASVNGKNISVKSILKEKGSVESILEKSCGHMALNLTGCTLDEVLYYISQGSPVLARYTGGRYVVAMSYNLTKVRYLDPVTGESTAMDRKELEEDFKRAGNVFYSYLEE